MSATNHRVYIQRRPMPDHWVPPGADVRGHWLKAQEGRGDPRTIWSRTGLGLWQAIWVEPHGARWTGLRGFRMVSKR